MSKPTTKCPRLALYVQESTDHNMYRITATVVTVGPRPDSPELSYNAIRNVSRFDGAVYRGLYLGDLEARCYGHASYSDGSRSVSYHDPLSYTDVHSIDKRTAEKMAKTLGAVERRLEKMRGVLGYPESFGAYLARLGQALGCEGMIFPTDEARHRSGNYDDDSHRRTSLGDGVGQVDHYARQWIATGKAQKDAVRA